MKTLIVALPGEEKLATVLAEMLDAESQDLKVDRFPDGETRIRLTAPVWGRTVVLVGAVQPGESNPMPLYLAAATLRELGARRVLLAAPYLAYMRQDQAFHPGEGVSARLFARWVSSFVDGLVTVDPHLHRIHDLGEIYSIPTQVAAAAPAISAWVATHIPDALLIGPDEESRPWVEAVAHLCGRPALVLDKRRLGDREVQLALPDLAPYRGLKPVLVDDIISTGHTLMEACAQLLAAGFAAPVCIGVHAVFVGSAHADLLAAGAAQVISCNTLRHASNAIDVHPAIGRALLELLDDPCLGAHSTGERLRYRHAAELAASGVDARQCLSLGDG
ncbi:MAG: ribose-phosphate diphosphokinase [Pseudomonadota bacterium]